MLRGSAAPQIRLHVAEHSSGGAPAPSFEVARAGSIPYRSRKLRDYLHEAGANVPGWNLENEWH